MPGNESQLPPRAKRPRWGLRTMGFLILTTVALITAMAQGHHTLGTLGSVILGLAGASYCSVKGVRDARARGIYGLLMDRRRSRT